MDISTALLELAGYRTNEIVVTTMGATREWSRLSNSPVDFHYLPSAMGHAPMVALGLALAQPQRHVIVLNGDGSLLMSLGCLVTIAASQATNLTMILLNNGVYEVTGGQQTAAISAGVNFVELARGAGIQSSMEFTDLESWKESLAIALQMPGPRFISLVVQAVREDFVPQLNQPLSARIAAFRGAIQTPI